MNVRRSSPLRRAGTPLRVLALALAASAAALAQPAEPRPFLWKISAPNAAPSYLFGTIHLPRPEVTKLATQVTAALDSADAVYTELPMDPASLIGMSVGFLLPDGQTLEDVVPADVYAEVLAELAESAPGMPLAPRDRLKIWAFTFGLMLLEDELAYPGRLPLDVLIFQRAAMANKETGGLETIAEQSAIFEDLSTEDQIALLRDTLAQLRTARQTGISLTDQLVESYLTGDLAQLEAKMDEMEKLGNYPELTEHLMARLLDQRNQIMADRMIEKLRANPQTSFFFAVGAAHLYGPTGLIKLLEKANYTLTRE